MDRPSKPERLTTAELAAMCQVESTSPGQPDQSACLELFRRALVEDDQQAWRALYRQYRLLVAKWGAGSGLDLDDLVNETFARFWRAVHQRGFPFSSLGAVLGYLKRCARTLVIDAARRSDYQQRVREKLQGVTDPTAPPLDNAILGRLSSQEFLSYLYSRLRDEEETLVFRLSYELCFKPREICQHYPQRFPHVRQVYRIKERILSRLANDPKVRRWRQEYP